MFLPRYDGGANFAKKIKFAKKGVKIAKKKNSRKSPKIAFV